MGFSHEWRTFNLNGSGSSGTLLQLFATLGLSHCCRKAAHPPPPSLPFFLAIDCNCRQCCREHAGPGHTFVRDMSISPSECLGGLCERLPCACTAGREYCIENASSWCAYAFAPLYACAILAWIAMPVDPISAPRTTTTGAARQLHIS